MPASSISLLAPQAADAACTPMNERKLGRTGISVSELCFGTMNFGWTVDRETAFVLLDTYRAAGGCFLQAACCLRLEA